MKDSVLVICSGGMDSSILLAYAKTNYSRVNALTFRYGQNQQDMEYSAVNRLCDRLQVPLQTIDLSFIKDTFNSALLQGAEKIPDGNCSRENMNSTVVPFRNGIMLAVAAGYANSIGADVILLGNHAGDHYIYPDCRPEFVEAMKKAVEAGTDYEIRFESPFVSFTKTDIVKLGYRLGVKLEDTYSCYKGGKKHCGTCGTCLERRQAFKEAGIEDLTEYEK